MMKSENFNFWNLLLFDGVYFDDTFFSVGHVYKLMFVYDGYRKVLRIVKNSFIVWYISP